MTTNTTCACGCGHPAPLAKRTNARLGHVKGEPLRFASGHNSRTPPNLTRYTVAENGCWLWDGSLTRKGYGRIQINGEHTGAHRAIYESIHGELPRDVHLDHECKNTRCVNPAHLIPTTPAINSGDTSRTRLCASKVREIIGSPDTCVALAKRFGVSRQAVSDARSGRKWKHVHELFSAMIDANEA